MASRSTRIGRRSSSTAGAGRRGPEVGALGGTAGAFGDRAFMRLVLLGLPDPLVQRTNLDACQVGNQVAQPRLLVRINSATGNRRRKVSTIASGDAARIAASVDSRVVAQLINRPAVRE